MSPLDEIVVTGIRKSVEQSRRASPRSMEMTEVVTAEDIAKMRNKKWRRETRFSFRRCVMQNL